jgi:hypothetical protein
LVRTRGTNERKTPVEDGTEPSAPAAVADASSVEKCVNCQYYDRRRARPTDGKAPMWGQCRRHSPHLNPVTAKAYVVEGVWPLVRDDDWCGEWRVLTRMAEEPLPETIALATADTPAAAPARARPAPLAAVGTPVAAGDD